MDLHLIRLLHGDQGKHLLHQFATSVSPVSFIRLSNIFEDRSLFFGTERFCQ